MDPWPRGRRLAEDRFSVVYVGPAMQSGRMDVIELAPALLAMAGLFSEANRTLNPGAPPVTLEMRATERGSFLVDLFVLLPEHWDTLVEAVNSDSSAAIGKIWKFVFGPASLVALLRWRSGRRAQRTDSASEVTYTTEDGDSLTVPGEVADLYDDVSIRRRTREIIEPLNREGVDEVRIQREAETVVVLTKQDLAALEAGPEDAPSILEQETEVLLEVLAPAFKPGNKWRLSLGQSTMWVSMDDPGFQARVQRREEVFGKGDVLRCRVRIQQHEGPNGLNTSWAVTDVLQHIRTGGTPLRLAFDAEEDSDPGGASDPSGGENV